jgi:hypothetical protein
LTSHVKIAGTWKDVAGIHAKVGGAWKEVSEGYTRIDGSWNQFYSLAPASSFDLLETQVLTSNQASVTFSSLSTYAADYQHLQIRMVARNTNTGAGFNDAMRLRINGDTGNNYASHRLATTDGPVISSANTSESFIRMWLINPNGTSGYQANVIDFLDAYSTSKNTTIRNFEGAMQTTTNYQRFVGLTSGVWLNIAAMTSIEFSVAVDAFATGSRFSLYGIRGG